MPGGTKVWEQYANGRARSNNVTQKNAHWEAELAHTRLGILWLYKQATVDASILSVALEGSASIAGGWVSKEAAADIGKQGGRAMGAAIKTAAYPGVERMKINEEKTFEVMGGTDVNAADQAKYVKMLEKASSEISKKIQEKLELRQDGLVTGVKTVKKMIKFWASTIASAASPLSSALDVVKGTAFVVDAAVQKTKNWIGRSKIDFANGHTSVILEAVDRAVWLSMGNGLWNVLKGGVALGLDVAGTGLGTVAKIIASAIEMITKVIWRLLELSRLRDFIDECKHFWNARATRRFHENGPAFAIWFAEHTISSPILAIAAMNSGYCGAPVHYVSLLDKSGAEAQGQLDAATSYLTRIQRWSAWYQKETGIFFNSTDPIAAAAFKKAKDNRWKPTGNMTKDATDTNPGSKFGKYAIHWQNPEVYKSMGWAAVT